MQEHFSREPPVYAKPKDGESPRPSAQPSRSDSQGPDYSGRPPPPLPGTQASPAPLNRPPPSSHGSNDDRPPLPAKPGMSSLATTSRGESPVAQHTALDRVQSPVVYGSVSAFYCRSIPIWSDRVRVVSNSHTRRDLRLHHPRLNRPAMQPYHNTGNRQCHHDTSHTSVRLRMQGPRP